MGNTLIRVGCIDQRLILLTAPTVASGGRNEDRIEFEFCNLWDGFAKTAVFYRTEDAVYHAVIADDSCLIPHEVLTCEGDLYFGVFGVKDDITRTSEVIKYKITRGALVSATEPADPTPDIYEQIMASLADLETRVKRLEDSGGGANSGGTGEVTPEVTPEAIAEAVETYLEENPVVAEPGKDGGYYTPAASQHYTGTMDISFTPSDPGMPAVDSQRIELPKGQDGQDGQDGVGIKSIVQTTTSTEDGGENVITVTRTNNSKSTFTVRNGKQGSPGQDGQDGGPGKDGQDGVSPTITVSKSGKVTTLTITDATGTKTATINDGADGADGAAGAGEGIPDYVRTEAETVARLVNQHQSGDSIVFPFLSDAHCGYYTDKTNEATKLAGQLLDLIGRRVPYDFIVNGGDMANGAWDTTREMTFEQVEDYAELTRDAHRGVPGLWMPGNHDDAPYMATVDRVTPTQMFGLFGRKSRVNGAVCPNGCNYGYLDLDNRRLRVIYLDTDDKRSMGTVQVGSGETAPDYLNAHNVSATQLQWLADVALDFSGKVNPAEWSIVVVSHVALNAEWSSTDVVSGASYSNSTVHAATVLNAYRKGKSGSITHNGATVTYDFTGLDSRAIVICCVHGHNHAFRHDMLGDIVSIGCPNVMNGRERESADGNTYAKTAGTAEGTSFCVLTIDRENQLIYADCVGAGYDRQFEYVTEVVGYTNQIPISTDTDGSIFNGKGWQQGYRLSSSGTISSQSDSYVTGFIPAKKNDRVYLKNVHYENVASGSLTTGNQRIAFYDASKTHIGQVNAIATAIHNRVFENDRLVQFDIQNTNDVDVTNVAYFRLNAAYIGDDSIITVNEPIE